MDPMTEPNPSPAPTKKPRKPRKKKRNQPRQAGTVRAVFARIRGLPWFQIVIVLALAAMGLKVFMPSATAAAPAVKTIAPVAPAGDSWESVARWVESGQITETDELVKVCRQLQKTGYLSDLSRIDAYAKGPSKSINDANRAEVVRQVRGG
jgi:hypothetical protein